MNRPGPADGMGGLIQAFCASLEALTDVANALEDTDLPVPPYGTIFKTSETGPPPPHTNEIPAHIDSYMEDVISSV